MSFSFFDHTGDVGVRLTGRTLDDLFAAGAAAFTETVAGSARVEPRRNIPLTLRSSAADLLLVDWLNEILYRFEVEQFLVGAAEVHVSGPDLGRGYSSAASAKGTALVLRATCRGETFDPARHLIKVLVKAITYHALDVHEDRDGWHATVIFDI